MIKTLVLLPEGPEHKEAWDSLEAIILNAFGGWTLSPGQHGAWKDSEHTIHYDNNTAVVVALKSWTQLSHWLLIVQWMKASFRQQAIYIEIAGIPEIIE